MKVTHAQAVQHSYGKKKITVELEKGSGACKPFSATTNDMPGYDLACEFIEDDIQGYYDALYDLIYYKIADQIKV